MSVLRKRQHPPNKYSHRVLQKNPTAKQPTAVITIAAVMMVPSFILLRKMPTAALTGNAEIPRAVRSRPANERASCSG